VIVAGGFMTTVPEVHGKWFILAGSRRPTGELLDAGPVLKNMGLLTHNPTLTRNMAAGSLPRRGKRQNNEHKIKSLGPLQRQNDLLERLQ
jgi:hypothetical protein